MGYWSKGVYYERKPIQRKQLGELRKIVDETTEKVKTNQLSASAAVTQLLADHEVLTKEMPNHPIITSGLIDLYAREFCPELPQTYKSPGVFVEPETSST